MTAAALLAENRRRAGRFDRLPDDLRPRDEAAAYAVQEELHELLDRGGRGPVSCHKIGCTTVVMQQYLAIGSPCAGRMLAAHVHASPARVSQCGFQRLGVECELAVTIGRDMDAAAPYDRASAGAEVAACRAAIEIVEDRYVDYSSLDTPTLIADDFFSAGCVLGRPRHDFDPLTLDSVTASMTVDGETVGSGVGADILGHPLDALAWLATSRVQRGLTLRGGDVVLLGSLVQTCWIDPGSEVIVTNRPLGEVRLLLV